MMEGRVRILETYPKSEEIIKLLSPVFMQLQTLYSTSDYAEQNCHVFVIRLYRFNSAYQLNIIEGILKIVGTNKKYEEIISFDLILCAFRNFYYSVVKRKRPCLFWVY